MTANKTPLPTPVNKVVRETYVLAVYYDKLTPSVKNRLAKDLLSIVASASAKNVDVLVGAPAELNSLLSALGCGAAKFVPKGTLTLCYLADRASTVPSEYSNVKVVRVDPGVAPAQKLVYSPSAIPPLFETMDGKEIPSTIPWTPPPHTNGNPFQWDF